MATAPADDAPDSAPTPPGDAPSRPIDAQSQPSDVQPPHTDAPLTPRGVGSSPRELPHELQASVGPASTDDPQSPPGDARHAAHPSRTEFTQFVLAIVVVVTAALGLTVHLQSFLDDQKFDGVLVSAGMRAAIRDALPRESTTVKLFARVAAGCFAVWLLGGTTLALALWSSWSLLLVRWGLRFAWLWWFGLYEMIWGVGNAVWPHQAPAWVAGMVNMLPFVHMLAWGGFFAGAAAVILPAERADGFRRALAHPAAIWLAAVAYAVVFSTLSVLQYRALMVPHGDTAMYEEHLWNLLHGKGFRSQLDGGRLFFGEHLEVIHILLLPIYYFFPSLTTLNVCLSVGLAAGAIAVRGIARRHTGSDAAANWLAVAYLLYFPVQYLNLEASLKTFRPENLAVPLLLFALWALEADRLRTMFALMSLALVAKEDYAIPIGMMGLFLAVRRETPAPSRNSRLLGLAILVGSVAYLWFVLNVFIPHFRGGPPHYVAYYPAELGQTPSEILANALRRPRVLFDYVFTPSNLVFLLMLVVPLAGLPLVGVGRLWVLAPSLLTLLLIQLPDARSPFFHFHAPLVPVLFWAAAEGLSRIGRRSGLIEVGGSTRDVRNFRSAILEPRSSILELRTVARFAAACCFAGGLFFGKSPLSIGFYDGHTSMRSFGRALYLPSPNSMERARMQAFEQLFPLIPLDARVAATDFVRPRFTHHGECHQYGEGGLKPGVVPESIDFIVVDLWGPFSNPVQGLLLKELEQQPERWEVFRWDRGGEFFFRVVRAKRNAIDSER